MTMMVQSSAGEPALAGNDLRVFEGNATVCRARRQNAVARLARRCRRVRRCDTGSVAHAREIV